MARKPNYRYERAERERRKAERQAIRDQRKAENRGVDEPVSGQLPDESGDTVVDSGDGRPGQRNG
jgi:hypothetical protein